MKQTIKVLCASLWSGHNTMEGLLRIYLQDIFRCLKLNFAGNCWCLNKLNKIKALKIQSATFFVVDAKVFPSKPYFFELQTKKRHQKETKLFI